MASMGEAELDGMELEIPLTEMADHELQAYIRQVIEAQLDAETIDIEQLRQLAQALCEADPAASYDHLREVKRALIDELGPDAGALSKVHPRRRLIDEIFRRMYGFIQHHARGLVLEDAGLEPEPGAAQRAEQASGQLTADRPHQTAGQTYRRPPVTEVLRRRQTARLPEWAEKTVTRLQETCRDALQHLSTAITRPVYTEGDPIPLDARLAFGQALDETYALIEDLRARELPDTLISRELWVVFGNIDPVIRQLLGVPQRPSEMIEWIRVQRQTS